MGQLNTITSYITQLLTQHIGQFAFLGQGMFLSFATIIIARTLQGMAAASARVIPISIIRDCYSGRHMARIMSLTVIVFIAAPILAPSIGKIILLFAPWPASFHALARFAELGHVTIERREGSRERLVERGPTFERLPDVIQRLRI